MFLPRILFQNTCLELAVLAEFRGTSTKGLQERINLMFCTTQRGFSDVEN